MTILHIHRHLQEWFSEEIGRPSLIYASAQHSRCFSSYLQYTSFQFTFDEINALNQRSFSSGVSARKHQEQSFTAISNRHGSNSWACGKEESNQIRHSTTIFNTNYKLRRDKTESLAMFCKLPLLGLLFRFYQSTTIDTATSNIYYRHTIVFTTFAHVSI